MDIQNNELLQQRYGMLTNPFAMPVPPMRKATELEVMEHSFWMNEVTPGRQLSNAELKRYMKRFRRFCEIQWNNRSRN